MSIPTNKIPENYRLISYGSAEDRTTPEFIFNIEDLLNGFVTKLWRVETGYGYSSYFDFVAANCEQDALDILADAVEDTEKRDSKGAIVRQLRDQRPWLGGARVQDADADPEREAEDSDNPYDYLGNGSYRYDLENVAIRQVPFKVHIELLPVQYI